ncbi:unnamed protein product, partial [Didymodactylos carnosus]
PLYTSVIPLIPNIIGSSQQISDQQQGKTTIDRFQERDKMLRERSIAEDYWKTIMKKIIEEERQELKNTIYNQHQQE